MPILISRAEARAAGLNRYFTGEPCKYGHIAERMLPSCNCVECNRIAGARRWAEKREECQAYERAYRIKNSDRIKAYREATKEQHKAATYAWRKANMDRFLAKKSAWYEANKDKIRQRDAEKYRREAEKQKLRSKLWKRENKEAARAHYHKWRSAQKESSENYTASDVRDILKLQRQTCAYCRKKVKSLYHIDHIIPLSLGGTNGRRNIQILCRACNLSKHSKHPIAFARQIGKLI